MKPIEFKEQTKILKESMKTPLPVHRSGNLVISCWSLSWLDRLRVLISGKVWNHQMTTGSHLQLNVLDSESPFKCVCKDVACK